MTLIPKRLGDVPQGLTPHLRDFLRRLKEDVEILLGAVKSQNDSADNPGSKAVTFNDLVTADLITAAWTDNILSDRVAALEAYFSMLSLPDTAEIEKSLSKIDMLETMLNMLSIHDISSLATKKHAENEAVFHAIVGC